LHRGNVSNDLGDGPGDLRREGIVCRHQGQEIGHNPNVACRSNPVEDCETTVVATDALQQRTLLEQRLNELNDLAGDRRRHATVVLGLRPN